MPTNAEVFAAFAARQPAEGRSVRSERTANGVVLYSYAAPIAVFADTDPAPVFTTRKFSQTTSKQQTQARSKFFHVIEMEAAMFVPVAKNIGASFALAR